MLKRISLVLFTLPALIFWLSTFFIYVLFLLIVKKVPIEELTTIIHENSYTKDITLIYVLSAMFWIYLYTYLTM